MALTPTTWNPADKDATVTLSGGDLTAASTYGSVRSVDSVSSGKYYWEITFPSGISQQRIGVATSSASISLYPGYDTHSWALSFPTLSVENNGSVLETLTATPTTTVSILLDAGANTVTFWADGVVASSAISITAGPYFAIYGYDSTVEANFGAAPFTYTPPAGYAAGLGFELDRELVVPGVKVFTAGSPSVIRGPNQVIGVSGLAAFTAGTPVVQLGYPETILPSGASVFSAGAPTLLPYSHRTVQVAGASLFQAGYPTIGYNPIVGGMEFIAPAGVKVFTAGTPTMAASASIQVSGTSVFSAGTPALHTTLGVAGTSLLSTGTPTIGVGLGAAGVSVFRAGTPQMNVTVQPQGQSLLRAGLPKVIAGGYVISPPGAAVFTAGTPRISNMTIHPWGKSHFRAGTPKLLRGTKC